MITAILIFIIPALIKNKNNNITIINDDHSEKTIEDGCVCIKI